MTEYLPLTDDTVQYSRVATAAVTGGQLVNVSGAPCGANDPTYLGIAGRDAAIGETFTVFCDHFQRPVAAGAIAKGDRLKTAANGQVTTWVSGTDAADLLLGIALEAGTAGNQVRAKFFR